MPGMGLIKRRLETEEQAVALATAHILKEHDVQQPQPQQPLLQQQQQKDGPSPDGGITTLETKYDADSGDWYVALGWGGNSRAIVRMDSILGTVTDTKEV